MIARGGRRALLLAAVALPARADVEFPGSVDAAGRRLVLNGTAARLATPLRIEVYRAALYLEVPMRDAEAILATRSPRLVEARYRRAVPRGTVVAAWEASLGAPLPPGLLDWLVPIAAGDVERQLFLADHAVLEGPRRPLARIEGEEAARRLLGSWIGPTAPSEALRRGLLGLP